MSTYKGIDLSNHNGVVDFEAAKAGGVEFVILRAGWGNDDPAQDDAQFERGVTECDRLGIPWGAYLYSYAMSLEEADSEAEHLLRLLEGKKPLYPVYLDMEDADGYKAKRGGISRELATDICVRVGDRMEAAGYYYGVYASKDWLLNKLDRDRLARFDIWLAQWNDEPTYDGQYGMWQHTSDGSVPGINGRVDLNVTTGYRDYPAHIGAKYETPPAPAEPVSKYSPGDRVHVKSTLYADSNGNGAGKSVDGEYTIDRVLPGRRAGILIGGGLGWVPEGNCAPAGTYAPVMAVGVQVRYTGRVYVTAAGDGVGKALDGVFTVDRYLPNRPYGVHIPAGWVRESDCEVVG